MVSAMKPPGAWGRSRGTRMRVGFVIDEQLPSWAGALRGACPPLTCVKGWASPSPVGEMRFGWVAARVNDDPDRGLRYELYRPGRRYDAVVFLKSMGPASQRLAARLRRKDCRILFDLNVDYLTPASGDFMYEGMRPSAEQRDQALAMLALSDAVVADSEHLADVAGRHHGQAAWIPDNVELALVPERRAPGARVDGRVRLLWSGTACKMVELLAIRDVLVGLKDAVELVLCTDDPARTARCHEPWRSQLQSLLRSPNVRIERFTSIRALLALYAQGGVFVAPRHLNNTYNLGHTEWKIALPMACGVPCLAAPQRSYLTVASRSGGRGIRICESEADWQSRLAEFLAGRLDWKAEGDAAEAVVRRHYATEVVARQHADVVGRLLRSAPPQEGA